MSSFVAAHIHTLSAQHRALLEFFPTIPDLQGTWRQPVFAAQNNRSVLHCVSLLLQVHAAPDVQLNGFAIRRAHRHARFGAWPSNPLHLLGRLVVDEILLADPTCVVDEVSIALSSVAVLEVILIHWVIVLHECTFPCIQFSELVVETASPVVQRIMHEFTNRADRHRQLGKAKVTLCDDMVRYHTQGLLDLVSDGDTPETFAPEWWASGIVLPLHKSVAYIQLSQRRCQVGMVAAQAIVARFLRQMGERLARNDYFLHATVAQQCLVAAYASAPMLPDAAEVGISNWRGIYRLFLQDQPAFPAHQPSWRYAWSSDNDEQTWLQQRHCQLVWAQVRLVIHGNRGIKKEL
ncbi:unnamed protein product [Symbiodinium sp. KB8]|nr:unnamed protein product [Symbiodinium sp. KB8]